MIKKLTLFSAVILLTFPIVKAQNWGGGNDDNPINWGFMFQYVVSEYKITKNANWRNPYYDQNSGNNVTDSLNAIYSPTSPGFGIGFVLKGRLTQNLDVRFTPSLVFNDRLMNFEYTGPQINNPNTTFVQKKVQATMVDLPLGLKVKANRLLNFSAYVLGGLKYSFDLASNKKTNDDGAAPIDKLIKNKKSFLSYEAGLGCDLYFEWFKLSPEFKVSYSFKDILKHNNDPYSNPIDKAKLRHFTFSLFIE